MNIDEAIKTAWKLVNGHRIIGLGSGTTIIPFIEGYKEYCLEPNNLLFIPTSLQAKLLLDRLGLQSSDLNSHSSVDITIDGCDAFTLQGDLVKGGGGCLLQEKIVAEASKAYVILAANRKKTATLLNGSIPLEVHSFAAHSIIEKIKSRLRVESISIRCGASGKLGPIVTDSGNLIVDLQVANNENLDSVQSTLVNISGVLETGLFLNMNPTIISFD